MSVIPKHKKQSKGNKNKKYLRLVVSSSVENIFSRRVVFSHCFVAIQLQNVIKNKQDFTK